MASTPLSSSWEEDRTESARESCSLSREDRRRASDNSCCTDRDIFKWGGRREEGRKEGRKPFKEGKGEGEEEISLGRQQRLVISRKSLGVIHLGGASPTPTPPGVIRPGRGRNNFTAPSSCAPGPVDLASRPRGGGRWLDRADLCSPFFLSSSFPIFFLAFIDWVTLAGSSSSRKKRRRKEGKEKRKRRRRRRRRRRQLLLLLLLLVSAGVAPAPPSSLPPARGNREGEDLRIDFQLFT